ncbi:unnamed protein product [Blumeria hordei]|uniref:Pal1-like protein n=2 Tax=Blumeria hordei TaxID=2867405 RepID=A0A383ULI6_BLUHO|nr:hypothetical protein BGHDH14_bgh04819 [Blumeria hordei DH14]SZF01153.1 unnamed protein product [Blumeria hordei]
MSTRELALRTLHLKLCPSPATFSQRREVLRTISTYGEVTMFRSLKYHPISPISDAFMVIFSTPVAAQQLLDASPVIYRVVSSDPRTKTTASKHTEFEQIFTINASSTSFNHKKFLSSRFTNPLHGPFFPVHTSKSFIGSALSRHISKDSIRAAGLLDWESDRGRGILRIRSKENIKTPGIMSRDISAFLDSENEKK